IRLTCSTSLQSCLGHADTVCRGGPYDVLHARDQRDRFGAELGTSQVEVRASEAVIRCGSGSDAPPPESPPPAAPAPSPSTPPTPPPATPSERFCVPASTPACVGPGACQGGPSSLPSGAGFG